MKKKILIGLGVGLGLFVATAIIVPLVVDVDSYRPEIEKQVNQKINGSFKLGKLSLSLWGQIRVDVESMDLKDAQDKRLLEVKDVYFHFPFLSVLTGSPRMNFVMKEPMVSDP